MRYKDKLKYQKKYFTEVPTKEPKCDGCIFEWHNIGKDCMGISKPECQAKMRDDNRDVIFKYE